MSSISSSIRLSDQMTPAINSMMKGMNSMISGFERMETASAGAIDTKSLAAARSEMAKAGAAFKQFEKSVEDAEKSQKEFNSTAKASTSSMSGMIGKVGALAAGYMSLQAVGNFIGMSDGYSQTTARLGLMNDGLQTTAELQTDIFKAANESHASYQSMSDMVSKLGLMAGDAFSSNDEIVDFAEQVSKQFVISGASAGETSNAMLQLTQAMASGVLRGDELNSIFENSPTLIQTIADYLGVPIGQIRAMAQEGEITADIVKNSMFKAANATDAKFEAMGMTFGQAWTIFQNKSNRAFQGVFTQMGQLANSDALDGFLDGLAGGVETAASIVSTVGSVATQPFMQELITDVGTGFTAAKDNFSSAWSGFVTQVTTDSPTISSNFSGMQDSWEKFFGVVSGDVENFDWGQMGEGFGELFGYWVQVETGAAGAVASVAAGFDSLMNLYWGVTTQDWSGASQAFNDYVQSIAGGIKNIIAIFVGQDKAEEIVGQQWLEFGKGSANMLSSGMEMNRSGVETASNNLMTSATTPMQNLGTSSYLYGQAGTNNLATGISSNQGAVSASSSGLYTAAINPVYPLQNDLTAVGTSGVTGMSSAIAGGSGDAGKSATEVKDNINKMFSPLPKDTRSIADYAMLGLKAGLDDSGSIESTIVGLTGLMLNTFKNKLGIHSPSTEMYDIGTNTMAGLFNSLADSDLVKFCESIVADMKAAFESGNFNLKAGIEYIGGGAAEFFKSIGIGGASMGDLITPLAGAVTSGFGNRDSFMTDSGQMSSGYHEGIDIGAAAGTPIGAAGAGTVIFAGWNGGYGNMVEIDHGNGLTSLYAHMESIATSLGQTVSAGQTIGYVGSTGNSTGAHLHFGLYQDGQAIDPSALWGYSSGTMSARAGIAKVGENGPELIGFGGGETVLNSKKTKLFESGRRGSNSIAASSGGVTVQVNMNGVTISNDMDIEVVADRLGSLIVEKMRTRANVA